VANHHIQFNGNVMLSLANVVFVGCTGADRMTLGDERIWRNSVRDN